MTQGRGGTIDCPTGSLNVNLNAICCISLAAARPTATGDEGCSGRQSAGLAEMTHAGLPVPPGFTIQTEACREIHARRFESADRRGKCTLLLKSWRSCKGQKLGAGENPLLVSVRSGAKFSMPGMMDTILNLGLNDTAVEALAKRSGKTPVRLRLLSPSDPDVRRCGSRHLEKEVRAYF